MTMSKQELKDEPIKESVKDAWNRLEAAIETVDNHDYGLEDILEHADQALYNRKHFSMAVSSVVSMLEDFITDFDENVDDEEEEEDEE